MHTVGIGFDTRHGSNGEESYPVPTVSPDFFGTDRPSDTVLEMIAKGESFDQFLHARENVHAEQVAAEYLYRYIAMTEPYCRMSALLSWKFGLTCGKNLTQLAQKYGVTKQAIQQDADRLCEEMHMRPTRYQRQATAKLKMKLRNFRKNAIPPEFCPLPR